MEKGKKAKIVLSTCSAVSHSRGSVPEQGGGTTKLLGTILIISASTARAVIYFWDPLARCILR